MAKAALGIEQVQRGPVLVAEGLPDGEVVVDRHRERDVDVPHGLAHVLQVPLELELRGVDTDTARRRPCTDAPMPSGTASCAAS